VVWQDWQVRVTSTPAEAGGPALLACVAPASLREHASVAAWYRDDAVLPAADHLCKSLPLVFSVLYCRSVDLVVSSNIH
jgi:hypothetical protein